MSDRKSVLKGRASMSSARQITQGIPQNFPPFPIWRERLNAQNWPNFLSSMGLAKSRRFSSLNDMGNANRSKPGAIHRAILSQQVMSGSIAAVVGLSGRSFVTLHSQIFEKHLQPHRRAFA